MTSDFRFRPVFPAQPKQIGRKKRNEPAVVVLLVETPFRAEMATANKPQRSQNQHKKNKGCPAGRTIFCDQVRAARSLHCGLRMQAAIIRQFRLHEKRKFCLSTWPFNFCCKGSRLLAKPFAVSAAKTFSECRRHACHYSFDVLAGGTPAATEKTLCLMLSVGHWTFDVRRWIDGFVSTNPRYSLFRWRCR